MNFPQRLEFAVNYLKAQDDRSKESAYAEAMLSGVLAEIEERDFYFGNPLKDEERYYRPVTPSQVRANQVAWDIIERAQAEGVQAT